MRILAIGVIAAALLSSASAQSKCFNVAAGYTYKNMQARSRMLVEGW